jgi:hypothetical protein
MMMIISSLMMNNENNIKTMTKRTRMKVPEDFMEL